MKLNIQLFADGEVTIEAKLETRSIDQQIAELEYDLEALQRAMNDPKATPKMLKEYQRDAKKVEKALKELRKQQELNNSQSGSRGILKSMAKWGLAIFSIRSAYNLIRQSASQLAQQNDEIAGKINAIKGSLTNMLAPVVEVIVNLVYRLLSYLNVITTRFLGIDLFKDTAKSGKSAVGTAKQLKKQLASFDEMNVLSDSSSGGGGGGVSQPKADPIDTSKFAETIAKYKEMWDKLLGIDRTSTAKMLLNNDKTWGLFKLGWFDTIQGIARMLHGVVEVFDGVWKIISGLSEGNMKKVKEGVDKLFMGIFDILTGAVQFIMGIGEMILGIVWGLLKSIMDGISNMINKGIEKFNNFVTKINEAFTKVRNKVSGEIEKIKKSLTDNFGNIGTILGNVFGDKFKTIINVVLGTIESLLNKPINAINKLITAINGVPGINIKKLSGFSFPRLAKGGIINQPGRGTYVGGAIGGESGREGVLPLTDSQQMELLGEAIGRYITINASITNTMNGRVISRELQKINNENNFANNM